MTDDNRTPEIYPAITKWIDAAEPPIDRDRGRARLLQRHFAIRPIRRSSSRAARWAMAVAAAILVAGLGLYGFVERAPVYLADGVRAELGAALANDGREVSLTFSEGTRVVLLPQSRGRVDRLDRGGGRMVLDRGALHAEVFHRDGSEWKFVSGPFEVVVTGTVLDVRWDPQEQRLDVSVPQGTVLVHGPVLGSEQVVRTGERCRVDVKRGLLERGRVGAPGPTVASASEVPEPAPSLSLPPASAGPAEPGPPSPAVVAPSWTALEEQGKYEEAFAAAKRSGLSTVYETASAPGLLRFARVAGLAGHGSVEREALTACRRRFPASASAAVAAYQLGRTTERPDEAVRWFETYLREAPLGPLAREASGRLVETYELAGRDRDARAAAGRYLRQFPAGPHAGLCSRILARPGAEPTP